MARESPASEDATAKTLPQFEEVLEREGEGFCGKKGTVGWSPKRLDLYEKSCDASHVSGQRFTLDPPIFSPVTVSVFVKTVVFMHYLCIW